MIVMDLEWNRSFDHKTLDEILQIGAVRIERLGGPIVDSFNVFIRPVVHKRFDPGARSLPELQQSKDSRTTFPAAWTAFSRWCGEDRVFAFWGPDDSRAIEQNCEYWGVPYRAPDRVYNFQSAFAHAYGAPGTQMALFRVTDFLGIPDVFDYHNALNDAMYTALVSTCLRQEDLDFVPLSKGGRRGFSNLPFEPKRGRRTGPYGDRHEALDDKLARSPLCPLCARRLWVRQWHTADRRQFYSTVSCPTHGRFLCRLTLSDTADGALRARLTVPLPTRQAVAAYELAKTGEAHLCVSQGRKKKPRKRSRTRKIPHSGD